MIKNVAKYNKVWKDTTTGEILDRKVEFINGHVYTMVDKPAPTTYVKKRILNEQN